MPGQPWQRRRERDCGQTAEATAVEQPSEPVVGGGSFDGAVSWGHAGLHCACSILDQR